jgi:hypothetical protein
MADKRAERIADLIKPLRVKPGSKVNLAKDFDPGHQAGVVQKKDGTGLLPTGITNGHQPGRAGQSAITGRNQ